MNYQKIYDTVKKHLLKQEKKSCIRTQDGNLCLYRGPNGLKCAIGALIPNKLYEPEMERNSVLELINKFALEKHFNIQNAYDDLYFLAQLQKIHDDFKPSQWTAKLRRFAQNYKLIP